MMIAEYFKKFKDKTFLKKFFLLTLLTVFCFSIQALVVFYFSDLPLWICICATLIITFLNVCAVLFGYLENKSLFRLSLTGIVFATVILAAYIILETTGFFRTFTDFEKFRQFILGTGKWGKLIYVAITIVQVVLVPIPSMITEVVATQLYGSLTAFLLSAAGVLTGSAIAYFIGKFLGKKIVVWIAGKENTEKYTKIFSERGRYVFIIMMLFPFFPDDIICMAAGLSSMPFWFFAIVVVFTRPISTAINCFFGSGNIIPFSGWGIPVWISIFVLILTAFIVIYVLRSKRNHRLLAKSKIMQKITTKEPFQVEKSRHFVTAKEELHDEKSPRIITNPNIINDKEIFKKIKSESELYQNLQSKNSTLDSKKPKK